MMLVECLSTLVRSWIVQYFVREPKNIKIGVMSHMVACIVNSAFSCEVFIKSLLVHHGKTVEEIHGHELYKLWAKYKELDIE